MGAGNGITPLDFFIICSFSCLFVFIIVVRCCRKRRQEQERIPVWSMPIHDGLALTTTPALMMGPGRGIVGERMLHPAFGAVNREIRAEGDTGNPSVNLQDWNEWRWILQLGPHLLAAAAHQNHLHALSSVNGDRTDSQRFLEQTKQRRQDYVHQALIHKTVKVVDDTCDMDQALRSVDEKSDLIVPTRVETSSGGQSGDVENDLCEDDEYLSCAICLKHYVANDRICWSRNPECSHHFHCDCVELWLLRNDHCPFCRKPYVYLGGTDEANEEADDNDNPPPRRVRPLRADEMENLERGVDRSYSPRGENDLIYDAEFVDMMASIERLYRRAHSRLFMEPTFGTGLQMTGPHGDQSGHSRTIRSTNDLPVLTSSPSLTRQEPSRLSSNESAADDGTPATAIDLPSGGQHDNNESHVPSTDGASQRFWDSDDRNAREDSDNNASGPPTSEE